MKPLPQLIGVPYDASSSFLRGSAAAPAPIRDALHSPAGNKFTERGADLSQLADAGDLALPDDAANARVMIQAAIELSLRNGFTPIALGGDHSITYPIMRAIARVHQSVTILHIDAHGDLYDQFDGDRFSHACPFARIMEEELCARLVQVGIRTLTPHQREQIRRFDVDTIEMQHFAGGARPGISGPVYLSIDLDGLDPAFAPGVSHREPGGLSVRDVLSMIHALDGPIVGADVVEFNPSQDLGNVTASVAAKIVREIAGAMLLQR
ncbi:MAG TPA: agmatinase [Vicinamibacterales bacterium]|nr:agmatinase [Vicinamibacterales bacterium]